MMRFLAAVEGMFGKAEDTHLQIPWLFAPPWNGILQPRNWLNKVQLKFTWLGGKKSFFNVFAIQD